MLISPPIVYHLDGVQTRTLTNISGVRFVDATGERVDCLVTFKEFPGESLPFTAYKYDSVAYARELYNDLIKGVFGPITPFVEPE